ncbi:DNA polymerase III subunit gamma and tau [Kribbella sp. CA-293567]|uniref:DNA polymerase III subunit gamma and tau n=1 Tax=Kribbella sp. CA-293567 TaxID=3002436 RepID=UPI0022DCEDF3|nr:DNA polymerase III subunit gamma and tau [Kribbella sp. CA-293567]WBQ05037.1 DNA polymerase III subunit gamma and tau [Kribbella sp. CA-293567]
MEAPLALYRRYRPETFSEVIGQDHVTVPLRNALSNNRVNHAYLFSGPRGCGKTTSARILARAINCEQGPVAEPCGVCKSCTDLARGGPGSIDVIEIDAASHGGVDDARDLRERAFFAPVESRYKIYIIDEAHMVTTQGFNALLKLVEEPPPHLKFIFATTEPEKVIGTIRSRTHHYPFRLVPPKALADYMSTLCTAEGVTIEPAALPLVVRAGAGSVRDSLSVLDQLIGGADEEGVTYRLAVQLLGFTPDSLLDGCVDGFAAHDSRAVFETIEKVIETGQDPKRFAEDLLRRLRDLVILSAVPNAVASGLIEAAEDQGERLQTQAAGIGPAELTRAADIVAAGLLEMRGATAPRLQLELICAKVLLPGADDSTNGIQARLDRMERRLTITGGAAGTAPAPAVGVDYNPAGTAPAAGAANHVSPDQAAGTAPGGAQAAAYAQPIAVASQPSGSVGGPGQADGHGSAASQGGSSASGQGSSAQGAAAGLGSGQGEAPGQSQASGQPNAADQAGGAGHVASDGAQDGASKPGAAGDSQSAVPAGASGQDAAAPAVVNNSGSRSGAWGAEPAASSSGGQAAASVNPPVSSSSSTTGSPAAPAQAAPAPAPARGSGPAVAGTSSGSVGLIDVRRLWPQILEAVKAKRRFAWIMLSQNAQVIAIDEQTLTLGLVNAGARESFARSGSDEILREAMIATIGLNRRVEAVVDPSSDPSAVAPAAAVPPSASSSSWDSPGAAGSGAPVSDAGSQYPSGQGGASGPGAFGSGGASGSASSGQGVGPSGTGAASSGPGQGPSGGSTGLDAGPSGGSSGLGAGASGGPSGFGSAFGPSGGDPGWAAGPSGGHPGPGASPSGAPSGAGEPAGLGAGDVSGGAEPTGLGAGASGSWDASSASGGASSGSGVGSPGVAPSGSEASGSGIAPAGSDGSSGSGIAPGSSSASSGAASTGADAYPTAGVGNAQATAQASGTGTAVRAPEGAEAVGVQNGGVPIQSGLQSDQQAGGPPAPAANPKSPAGGPREQTASKRRAAEAAVAAEQSRRASQVQVVEVPLTPEEEAEAIGDDDLVLEEDSRSHTDLLAETLGAQIISEEPN